jgi:hypothetical protein
MVPRHTATELLLATFMLKVLPGKGGTSKHRRMHPCRHTVTRIYLMHRINRMKTMALLKAHRYLCDQYDKLSAIYSEDQLLYSHINP